MTAKKARTADDWQASHDPDVIIPNKIRAALAALLKQGPEHYEYEADFAKLAGVSLPKLAQYRAQFDSHIVLGEDPTGRRTSQRGWFGNPKTAKRLRDKSP